MAQRARPSRATVALVGVPVGAVSVAVGAGLLPHLVKQGLTSTALLAVSLLAGGLVLAGIGTIAAARGRGVVAKVGIGTAVLVWLVLVLIVVGPPVAVTNVPSTDIDETPDARRIPYEDVTLETPDGVELAGWYVPPSDDDPEGGPAVVLLHGAGSTRSNVLDEAEVLVRHGFGVLMVDARGHGESDGRAMDFGWHGDADVAAATELLATRSEVDRERIGLVGMSMGGEEAIGASAGGDLVRAVVAEGATARNADDEDWLSDVYGVRGAVQERIQQLQNRVTDLLSDASPPIGLREAVRTSGEVRYLLVTAGEVPDEGHAAAHIAEAAPDRVEVWTVAGAGHTDGLETAPDEWEARVVAFLDDALAAG